MPDDLRVYIAEIIWFEENPVDGRVRVAVCATLDAALAVLRKDPIHGGDLVATETESGALGTDTARTWAVHDRQEAPDDEGHLWITEERVIPGDQRDFEVRRALAVLDDSLYEGAPYTLAASDEVLGEVDAWAATVQIHIAQARRRRARKDTPDG